MAGKFTTSLATWWTLPDPLAADLSHDCLRLIPYSVNNLIATVILSCIFYFWIPSPSVTYPRNNGANVSN
jgi:hypothetical protein